MNPIPPTALQTFEDFCALVEDGQKADLIDGVICMASPDNFEADELFGWVHTLMTVFARHRNLGKVHGSRAAFRLDDANGPEPDIAFVRKDRTHLTRRGFFAGPPDLAVEIVSPDSVARDYKKKRKQYERGGIPEYWIIDPMAKRVTLLRLGKDGKYREARRRRGVVRSRSLAGFWLRVEWLWQDPLPDPWAVLQEILSPAE